MNCRKVISIAAAILTCALGALSCVTVVSLLQTGQRIHVHPMKVHIDASEHHDLALVSVDAELLGLNESLHGVSVTGGRCEFESADADVHIPFGDLVEINHKDPTKVHVVAALAPEFLQQTQLFLSGKSAGSLDQDLLCSFDVKFDLYHTGLMLPHRIKTLSRISPAKDKVRATKAWVASGHREVTWPNIREHMQYNQTHRLHVQLPSSKALLRFLHETPVTIKAGISLIDPTHDSTELRGHIDSELHVLEPSPQMVLLTLPIHTAGRVHLGSLSSAVSSSVSGTYSPLRPRGKRPLQELIAEKLDRQGQWEPTRLLELQVRNPRAPLATFCGDRLTVSAARNMREPVETAEPLVHSLRRLQRALSSQHGTVDTMNLTGSIDLMLNDMPVIRVGLQLLGKSPWKATMLLMVKSVDEEMLSMTGDGRSWTSGNSQASASYIKVVAGLTVNEDTPSFAASLKFETDDNSEESRGTESLESNWGNFEKEAESESMKTQLDFSWDGSLEQISMDVKVNTSSSKAKYKSNLMNQYQESWFSTSANTNGIDQDMELSKAQFYEGTLVGGGRRLISFLQGKQKGELAKSMKDFVDEQIPARWRHMKDGVRRSIVEAKDFFMKTDKKKVFSKDNMHAGFKHFWNRSSFRPNMQDMTRRLFAPNETEDESMYIRFYAMLDVDGDASSKANGHMSVTLDSWEGRASFSEANTALTDMTVKLNVDGESGKFVESINATMKESTADKYDIGFAAHLTWPETSNGYVNDTASNPATYSYYEFLTTMNMAGNMLADFSNGKDVPVTGDMTMGPFHCSSYGAPEYMITGDFANGTRSHPSSGASIIDTPAGKEACRDAVQEILDSDIFPSNFGETTTEKMNFTLPNPFGSLFDLDNMKMKSPQMQTVTTSGATTSLKDVEMPSMSVESTDLNGQTTMVAKLVDAGKEMLKFTGTMPTDMDVMNMAMDFGIDLDDGDSMTGKIATTEANEITQLELEVGDSKTPILAKLMAKVDYNDATYGDDWLTMGGVVRVQVDNDGTLETLVSATLDNKPRPSSSIYQGYVMKMVVAQDEPIVQFDGQIGSGKYEDRLDVAMALKDSDGEIIFDVNGEASSLSRGADNKATLTVKDGDGATLFGMTGAADWVYGSIGDTYTVNMTANADGKEVAKMAGHFINTATTGNAGMSLKVDGDNIVNMSSQMSKVAQVFSGDIQLQIKDVEPKDIPTISASFSEGFIDNAQALSGCQQLHWQVDLGIEDIILLQGGKIQKAKGTDNICLMGDTLEVKEKGSRVAFLDAELSFPYDWDLRPPTTTVKSIAGKATTEVTMAVDVASEDDASSVTETKVQKVMAEAAGVDEEDVIVEEIVHKVEVTYSFTETVTESSAKTAIAQANGVTEDKVSVTIVPKRRLAELLPSGRRLAGVDVIAVIQAESEQAVAQIMTSTKDTAKVVEKLADQGLVVACTVKEQPKAKVEFKAKIVSKDSTPVEIPDATEISQIGTALGGQAEVKESALSQPLGEGVAEGASSLGFVFALLLPWLSMCA